MDGICKHKSNSKKVFTSEGSQQLSERQEGLDGADVAEVRQQFSGLRDLLKSIVTSRKLASLYGLDHPTTVQAVDVMVECIQGITSTFTRPTLVFADDGIVLNGGYYAASAESQSLCQRLRARGVMAVTFIDGVSYKETAGFLGFLNEDPSVIKSEGGPSDYLRRRAVLKIVVTESVYSVADGEDKEGSSSDAGSGYDVDRTIGAVIEWLEKHDEEDDLPHLPVVQILSDPDSAARLIHEAVTKLHVSRRGLKPGEITDEVVQNLKELASGDPEGWDNATPQVRKALSKLPSDMRKADCAFLPDVDDIQLNPDAKIVDPDEVERVVSETIVASRDAISSVDVQYFYSLLDAKPAGLPMSWRSELTPHGMFRSPGKTYEFLMELEDSPVEHSRIAGALVSLIPRAVEVGDLESALSFAASLVEEAKREDSADWRAASVKSALRGLDADTLMSIVTWAANSETVSVKETAAALISLVPNTVLSIADLLSTCKDEIIRGALRKAIASCGAAALPVLEKMVKEGSAAAADDALDILADIGTTAAVRVIADAISVGTDSLVVRCIESLPKARIPLSAETCRKALYHKSADVRIAALEALGKLKDIDAVGAIGAVLHRRGLSDIMLREKTAAIRALGNIGGSDARGVLEQVAKRKVWFNRNRYESVRKAAEDALASLGFGFKQAA